MSGEVKKSIYGRDKLNEIVEVFINQLESGVPCWVRPYSGNGTFAIPQNFYTKRHYRGINNLVLWDAMNRNGYETAEFLSYKQSVQLGGHVRKGEKGVQVIYFEMREKDKEPDESTGEIQHYFWTKVYTVFNVAQIEGLKVVPREVPLPLDYRYKHADEFVRTTGIRFVTRKGSVPCYNVRSDIVTMPPLKEFKTQEEFISCKFHEISHYAQNHLDMVKQCKFGDHTYSWLEICAEMSSAFLGAYFGIPLHKCQHPEYMAHWISALREKPQILWSASAKAQQCYDYLLKLGGEQVVLPMASNE